MLPRVALGLAVLLFGWFCLVACFCAGSFWCFACVQIVFFGCVLILLIFVCFGFVMLACGFVFVTGVLCRVSVGFACIEVVALWFS